MTAPDQQERSEPQPGDEVPVEVRAVHRAVYYRGEERLGRGKLEHPSAIAIHQLATLSIKHWPNDKPPERFVIERRWQSDWEPLV